MALNRLQIVTNRLKFASDTLFIFSHWSLTSMEEGYELLNYWTIERLTQRRIYRWEACFDIVKQPVNLLTKDEANFTCILLRQTDRIYWHLVSFEINR